ncbi:hypothetical protein LV779_12215 [Streptomyces thinghirensis]|nr:hypothetical protein [Streptomyces thinghirensis]
MTHRPTGELLQAVRLHSADESPVPPAWDDGRLPESGAVDPAVSLTALLHRHGW